MSVERHTLRDDLDEVRAATGIEPGTARDDLLLACADVDDAVQADVDIIVSTLAAALAATNSIQASLRPERSELPPTTGPCLRLFTRKLAGLAALMLILGAALGLLLHRDGSAPSNCIGQRCEASEPEGIAR